MARGGSRGRRSYARDARGRFASTGTTGRKAKPARTTFRQRQAVSLAKKRGQTGFMGSATRTAKARLKASKAKLTPGASRQQKAAVTRAQRMAAALAGQRRIKTATPAGVMKGRVKRDPGAGARLAGKGGKKPAPKLSATQRAIADRARTNFKEDNLGLGLSPSYRSQVAAVMKKFGVDNRIATQVLMQHGYKMGTAGGYVHTSSALKTISRIRKADRLAAKLGRRVTLPDRVMPKGQRRKEKGPKLANTISKTRRKKAAKQSSATPKPVLGPKQVAGARKRASETPEAFAKRKLDSVRFKLNQLSERKGLQESALNRRRGRLEGDARKKAATDLAKTKRSLARLKDAEQKYSTAVTRRQDQRNWNLSVRTGRKAPANKRTAMNRLATMNRRVSYLRKNEQLPRDKWGRRQFTGKLAQASKDRGAALAGISGQRFTYRSKRRATVEQRVRTNRVLDLSRKRYQGGQSGDDYLRYGIKTKRDTKKRKGDTIRATSRQGNLLSGRFERVRSGKFRPLAGRTWF